MRRGKRHHSEGRDTGMAISRRVTSYTFGCTGARSGWAEVKATRAPIRG